MASNFGVAKVLALCPLNHVFYGVESWSRVLEWSGIRFWRDQSRMECSCDVCVCVAKFLCNLVIVMYQ